MVALSFLPNSYEKLRIFCSYKNIINTVKRLAIAWAKVLLIHKLNKGLIFRIYKKFLKGLRKRQSNFKK